MLDPTLMKYLETGGVFAILAVVLFFYRRDAASWQKTVQDLLTRAEKREDALTNTLTGTTAALSTLAAVLDKQDRAATESLAQMRETVTGIVTGVSRIEGAVNKSPKRKGDG